MVEALGEELKRPLPLGWVPAEGINVHRYNVTLFELKVSNLDICSGFLSGHLTAWGHHTETLEHGVVAVVHL